MNHLIELLRRLKAIVLGLKGEMVMAAQAMGNAIFGVNKKFTHKFLFEAYRPIEKPMEIYSALGMDGIKVAGLKHVSALLNLFKTRIPIGKLEAAMVQDGLSLEAMTFWQALKERHFKWAAEIPCNLVVNVGLDDILDKYYKGSTYTAAHYCGITGTTPSFAAGDTMASHAGWTEVTAYDEAARQTITWGTVSGQSVDNSASKAVFTISTNNTTIGGGFVTTNNTKGGSTGTLVGGAAFSAGDKTLDDNDTLNVTVTATASSS